MSEYRVMPELKIGPFTAELPIIQGGMGVGISLSGLASAVAEAGGIGVISTVGVGMLEPGYEKDVRGANRRILRKEIQTARSKTKGLLGCNIMVALSDYNDHLSIALDEEIDLVFLGAGLPLKFPADVTPDRLKSGHTRFVPIISSGRVLTLVFSYWEKKYNTIPDAVVVEGPLAGGHLGFKTEQLTCPAYSLEFLVEDVISAKEPFEDKYGREIPVIAAGGIYDGGDIRKILDLGASGVQMGTRFVATHECDADMKFKEAYLGAGRNDIRIIQSPVGLPGRAIKNGFLEDVSAGQRKPFKCPWKCLRTCNFKEAPYCIADALVNAKLGNIDDGFVFAGANAWRVNEIVSVRELISQLVAEYVEADEVAAVAV